MDLLGDVKIPLTAKKVRSMARASFADSFDSLCSAVPDLKWLEFDVKDPQSIGNDRAVFRHLTRSEHNRLLVVGWYSPGPASDEKPTERVAAHVHADPAEVRFYRIVQAKDGPRSLEDVNSTSAVDFDPPFCDVGDDSGDHKAGHRVTALIEWFFLEAGLISELARSEGDPTKFPRNFRHACMWVSNRGINPVELVTRRPSGPNIQVEEKESIPVRPKRASTYFSRHTGVDEFRSPPIKRSATDTAQVKRQRDEDGLLRPSKHRRTLSEQITPLNLSHLKQSSNPPSPRTPTLNDAERINRALGFRIINLHEQYVALKSSFEETDGKQVELQKELDEARSVVARAQGRSEELETEVKSLRARLKQAEDESAKLRAEILGNGREGLERKARGSARP